MTDEIRIPRPYPQVSALMSAPSGTQPDPQNRYNGHGIVIVDHDGVATRTMETWERPNLPPALSSGAKYYYVKPQDAYRPDTIAYKAFGNPKLWWWVMYSNRLFDTAQLKPGITLQIVQPPYTMPNRPRGIV